MALDEAAYRLHAAAAPGRRCRCPASCSGSKHEVCLGIAVGAVVVLVVASLLVGRVNLLELAP